MVSTCVVSTVRCQEEICNYIKDVFFFHIVMITYPIQRQIFIIKMEETDSTILIFWNHLIILRLLHTPVLERSIKRPVRSEEHTSELQSRFDLVCRLLLEKKKKLLYQCGIIDI